MNSTNIAGTLQAPSPLQSEPPQPAAALHGATAHQSLSAHEHLCQVHPKTRRPHKCRCCTGRATFMRSLIQLIALLPIVTALSVPFDSRLSSGRSSTRQSSAAALFSYKSSHHDGPGNKPRSHSSSSTPLFNTHQRHIKVTSANSRHKSSQSAMDRLHVELVRSQLSLNLAEQRANRLEVQLKDYKRKYDGIKSELDREKRRSRTVDGRQTIAQKAPITTVKASTTTVAADVPFTGNSFDDLPPFAAALAANAEREERERRRKLGLLDEDDANDSELDLDVADFASKLDVDLQQPEVLPTHHESIETEQHAVEYSRGGSNCATTPVARRNELTPSTESFANDTSRPTLATDADEHCTNLFSTINNNTINAINSQYTPQYINDNMQTLRQNCILLTHQRATLQQKLKDSEAARKSLHVELKAAVASERVLRGLQADWTRRLSETRKEIDLRKDESDKQLKRTNRKWKSQVNVLEQQVQALQLERNEFKALIDNQKNITFVMNLFCQLAKQHVASSLRNGKARIGNRIRYGNNPRPSRMLTVGGADQATRKDTTTNGRRQTSLRWWKNERKGRVQSQTTRQRQNDYPRDVTTNIYASDADSPLPSSQNTDVSTSEPLPLLVRKNKYRQSKLHHRRTIFKEEIIRDDEFVVPDFMRDV